MSYLGVCTKCERTYYVDEVTNDNHCSCGGLVVVGVPPITKEQYENATRSEKNKYETATISSYKNGNKNSQTSIEDRKQRYANRIFAGEAYETEVEVLYDDESGNLDVQKVQGMLKQRSIDGWRLVAAYCNEVGHTSEPKGLLYSFHVNSTMCQHFYIFERRIISD